MVLHQQLLRAGTISVASDLDNLIVPGVTAPDLLLDPVMTLLQAVGEWVIRVTEEFTLQMRVIQPQLDAEAIRRVVRQLQVDVVVRQCCPCSEGNGSVHVGEHIESVPPALCDRERAVPCDPEQQIAQLAQPSSRALGNRSLLQHQAIQITLSAGGTSHQFPYGECFAGPDHHALHPGDGQFQIPALVVLKLQVNSTEGAEDQRLVPEFRMAGHRSDRTRRPCPSAREPVDLSPCDVKLPTKQLPDPAALNGPGNFKHAPRCAPAH